MNRHERRKARQAGKRRPRGISGLFARWSDGGARRGRLVGTIHDVFTALEDPRIQRGTWDFMTLAYHEAMAGTDGNVCYGCGLPWTQKRTPIGIVVPELVGHQAKPEPAGGLGGLCGPCFVQPARIARRIEADFGSPCTVSTATGTA